MDVHDATHHYVNGPEAFLVTLLGEYKDAQKRFEHVYREISDLIMPPLEFMFDSDIRDRLLFEDEFFTMSRRYFWGAYMQSTLESLNSMLTFWLFGNSLPDSGIDERKYHLHDRCIRAYVHRRSLGGSTPNTLASARSELPSQ